MLNARADSEVVAKATSGPVEEDTRSRWVPAPWILQAVVPVVLGLLWSLANLIDCSEIEGIMLSAATATMVWVGILLVMWRARIPTRFSRWLTVVLAIKTIAGVLFFYLVFAPASDLQDASSSTRGRVFGDTGAIEFAINLFLKTWNAHGLHFAVFGDYYRGFNNSGVSIVFGLLYAAFGPYLTVPIPWNAVAMGLVALCMYATGEVLGFSARENRTAALVMLFMPTFFFGPPLYRDQFMLALIMIVVYSMVVAWKTRSYSSIAGAVAATALLIGLRGSYALLPAYVAGVFALVDLIAKRKPTVWLVVSLAGLVLAGHWASKDEMPRGVILGAPAGDVAQMAFGGSGFGKLVFLLLTPMPWYQKISPNELVTQIFDYPQTLIVLALFICLCMKARMIVSTQSTMFLVLVGGALWMAPALGPALFARYSYMALPLLLLAAARVQRGQWLLYGGIAAVFIAVAHLGYELAKL